MAVTASNATGAQTWWPTRKLQAGGGLAAFCTLLVYVYNNMIAPDHPLPADVAAAITTFAGSLAAYLMPPAADQTVTESLPASRPTAPVTI